ncbi:major facilitator superfamily domain-containing protein [Rhodocollybia butyracea]|uniref:Major facilitator superfamily domain-containing protein n=1 Tax=Rhodocollybia butyracea TaxID=206335 RepID=A0A9P5PRX0_9AGAR|nr:major facilitator superfamily domain-containing protein [Rhodocollybia butyracea]
MSAPENESPPDPTSEATPLLYSTSSAPRPWYSIRGYSPAIFIIPVIVLARLASNLPTSTTVYLIQQIVCRNYYQNHDPSRIPPDGTMSDDMCEVEDVQQQYSAVVSLIGVCNGIACIIGYSAFSYFSSRYGRKPAVLVTLGLALLSNSFLLLSQIMDEKFELALLLLWIICDLFANFYFMLFLSTTYVFDMVDAENRSSFISMMYGWMTVGGALAFAVGGALTLGTQSILPVFRAAAVFNLLAFLFALLFLPESFTIEKRAELRRRAESAESRNLRKGFLKRLVLKSKAAVAPFNNLKPVYNERTGRHNWRTFVCALHLLLVETGANYAPTIMIIYLTAKYSYKPDEMGFLLSFFSISYAVVAGILVPLIIRGLRPVYKRRFDPTGSPPESTDTVTKGADRLNIHISMISWIAEVIAFILFTYMRTKTGHYTAIFFLALGAGKAPVFRGSLPPSDTESTTINTGETLAAVEMVGGIGMLISPLYMGTVFSSTVIAMPSLVFYTNGLVVLLGVSVLLLIKDSDRYQAESSVDTIRNN